MKLEKFSRGVGLIEVLIALLVMGLGIIGFAALQLTSVRSTEDTYANGQAIAIAQDVIERIKANPGGLGPYKNEEWTASSADCYRPSFDQQFQCTPEQLAKHDITKILSYLQQVLPEGKVDLNTPCPGSSNACVVVAWGGGDTDLNGACNPDDVDTSEDPNQDTSTQCVIVEFVAVDRTISP